MIDQRVKRTAPAKRRLAFRDRPRGSVRLCRRDTRLPPLTREESRWRGRRYCGLVCRLLLQLVLEESDPLELEAILLLLDFLRTGDAVC